MKAGTYYDKGLTDGDSRSIHKNRTGFLSSATQMKTQGCTLLESFERSEDVC